MKCETCGSFVTVAGRTTHYYIPSIDVIKEALEFYANENEWIDYKAECSYKNHTMRVHSHFDDDFGAKARAALAAIE